MSGTRFIVAGSLIDGSTAEVRRNVFLAAEEGIITAIGPAPDLPRQGGASVDDLSHCTIVPSLVDCSVSLSRSPALHSEKRQASEEAEAAAKAEMLARHLRYCHAHGVLGVADSGDTALAAPCQEGVAQGGSVAIRSSVCLGGSGQDGAARKPADGDFLKISYTGNIEERDAPAPRLGQEELVRLLARRGGRKAVVVANGPRQVAEALAAGCDAIEQGYGMGEANLRRMAAQGVLWIPSVVRAKNGLDGAASGGTICCRFSLCYAAPGKADASAEAFWKKTLAEQLAQLRLARELGVKTAVGTGAGSVGILHGEAMVEEMKLFIKGGYSLAETIQAASENGARFFGMEELGALAVGRKATFLIARGSAQQLPRKLAYLEGIYVDGAPSPAYRKNPVKKA